MKTFRLLIASLFCASASTVMAQNMIQASETDYSPTVYLISVAQSDPATDCDRARELAALNAMSVAAAQQDYQQVHRPGFQQVDKPQFIFATRQNKFSFAIGGFVNLRAAYDFDGIVQNTDFVTYNIPIPGTYATRQKLNMDATTTRIFLRAVANTSLLGRVNIFIDADFRGGAPGSYTPRVRSAYVNFKGFTLGRDVTTFCDLGAAPNTIDFQGPNAYNFNFATMIRYEVNFARKHMTFGLAAEMPHVSGSYGEGFAPIPQRVPDLPVYLQVAWDKQRSSHIRLSGVYRRMYFHDITKAENTSEMGWGAQFSGTIKVWKWLRLYMNGVYGQGITPYIQDLTGSGLDFTPRPNDPARIQTVPMWGAQAAAQISLSRRVAISGGYSMVEIDKKNGAYAPDQYMRATYIFGNIFYQMTPRFKIAAEYLYGTRENMDKMQNHARRINLMAQYSF